MARRKRRLGAVDFETDPFKHGRTVRPFQWGFWDGETFTDCWADDETCPEKFVNFLETLENDFLIYAHNGGKFDFLFLLPWIAPDPVIIGGRIVECRIGRHILRDSYAILPVRLGNAAKKLDIDMRKLEAGVRHRHREEITRYLRQDCVGLLDAVVPFRERLGGGRTMAGAAMKRLKGSVESDKGRPWPEVLQRLSLKQDAELRPWFFGGRVSCFEQGLLRDDWQVRDVTSMYPAVMKSEQHPTGRHYVQQTAIDDRTDFAVIDAWSDGALPLRQKNGSLDFPKGRFTFSACGHEIRTGLELGMLRLFRVLEARRCTVRTDFATFVDEHFALRKEAEAAGDEEAKLHWKLVLNSSYGRFALDPDRLYEWRAVPTEKPCYLEMTEAGYEVGFVGPKVTMWRRPVDDMDKARALLNVGTGASITSAARARLLHGIARADRPIYCDTDSLVCRNLDMPDASGLGAWKLEAQASEAAVAGKKLYALFGDLDADVARDAGRYARLLQDRRIERADVPELLRVPVDNQIRYGDAACVKLASKGVRLLAPDLRRVAAGEEVTWRAEAPTFNCAGGHTYLVRTVRMTMQ